MGVRRVSTMTTRSLRSMLRAAFLVAVVLCLLGGGAVASVAQGDDDKAQVDRNALAVSIDGITWTESITQPLFDPEARWVPGEVQTSQFYVRNNKPERGALSLVLERPAREALLDSGFLTIAARADDGPWVEVASGGRTELIDSERVRSQEAVAVELRASLDVEAPNTTMVLDTDLEITLRLTQAGVVADATSTDGPHDPSSPGDPDNSNGTADGVLPDTGSPLRPWVLPLALLFLGGGAVLIARRDEDEQPEELQLSLM